MNNKFAPCILQSALTKTMAVVLTAAIVCSCSGNKNKAVDSDEDSTATVVISVQSEAETSAAYDSLVVAEARAAVDEAYRESEEYQEAHDAYQQALSEVADDMTEAQQLLMQLEQAVCHLEDNGRYFANHVQEMQNPVNQQRMRIYADKVKELRRQLNDIQLLPDEQTQFDSLKERIKF